MGTESLVNIVSGYLKQAADEPEEIIDRDLYGLEIDVAEGIMKFRLGNWTTAGWHWDGTSDDNTFGLYLYRIATAREGLAKSFLKDFAGLSPEAQEVANKFLREAITDEGALKEIAYSVTGDNTCHHFGHCSWDLTEDSDRVADFIADSHDLASHLGVDQRELNDFLSEYYWSSGGQSFTEEAYEDALPALTDLIKRHLTSESGDVPMFVKHVSSMEDLFYSVDEIMSESQMEAIFKNYKLDEADLGEKLAEQFEKDPEEMVAAVQEYFKSGNWKRHQRELEFEK